MSSVWPSGDGGGVMQPTKVGIGVSIYERSKREPRIPFPAGAPCPGFASQMVGHCR